MKKLPKLIRKWKYRINRQNANLLIIICGQTGSGKSYSALTIAKMINSKFDIKKHVVFNVEDFMSLLNNGKLRRGDVIVWDEAGIGIPAREWWTISNKAINYVLQTFRHLNLCVIFTTPSFDYIDKQTRILFHIYIETVKIDYNNQRVIIKIFENTFNPRMGKPYQKYTWTNGIKNERHNIGKPTKQMRKEYEELKKEFSLSLREGVEKDVKKAQLQQERKKLTDDDWIELLTKEGIDTEKLYDVMAFVGCAAPRGRRIQARFKLKKNRTPITL